VDMLELYLRNAATVRTAGVKETSFYPALATLFDSVGKTLKPRVRCIIHPAGKGAGLPDGGFFTPDQLRGDPDTLAAMQAKLLPARGVLEVKGAGEDVAMVARSPQVKKYLDTYGQVLVTNLRDFLLVGRDAHGALAFFERYVLAPDEPAFWQAARHPEVTTETYGATFVDFLKRVMLTAAPLTDPEKVAWFLASYARDARFQLEGKQLPALASIRIALEDALGLHFRGEQGDHFFLSTFLQTLFYGVFSAWVLWHTERPDRTDRFEWRMSEWYLRVPVIASLFEMLATRRTLEPLGLLDTLDRTAAVLNRVDRAAFFAHFEEENAVQYFYEPFLKAFDPVLREQLGVWYTPPEIVRYMVARADAAVRDELGIPLGLADPRVQVLDPCCGTGAYLVEVVKLIAARLAAGGGDALSGDDLKHAALSRVFGFEILPAPYVVAHLQLGLLLARLGAPLNDSTGERVGVYLTNALTGWVKEAGENVPLPTFPELADERDAAARVKQDAPILVVIGNPPYNGFSGTALDEEGDLSRAYRVAKATRQPQGQGLNDLYVRFFRAAERRIVEGTGAGVVCFISNYSWLDGLSFTAMRERYMDVFDRIEIDNLNGDKYRTGKVTPAGLPDPSAFSTATNREGIQVGTAIALLVRREGRTGPGSVRYREWWGQGKRTALLASLTTPDATPYHDLLPPNALGLPFAPAQVGVDYEAWHKLPDLFPASFPGVKTSRDDVVVDIDRDRLVQRMTAYFDPAVSDAAMAQIAPGAMEDGGRFNATATRAALVARGFLPHNIVRYAYRPFDVRWLYWEPETKLLDEKRTDYYPHVFAGNVALAAVQQNRKEYNPPLLTTALGSLHIIERGANVFPLYLRPVAKTLFDTDDTNEPRPNLTDRARDYLASVGGDAPDLFFHSLATLHAPLYRTENAGALRQDWPRVPLPATGDALRASAALGRQVAALLDTETPVAGITEGTIRLELRRIASIQRVGGGMLNTAVDLAVRGGWGHGGEGKPVMPARGKVNEREYTPDERAALADGVASLRMTEAHALTTLGATCADVYLNNVAYWSGVPLNVWHYTIGGYQVLKKWLSYREQRVLGRALGVEEAREVTAITRRIATLLLLSSVLNENYAATKRNVFPFRVGGHGAVNLSGVIGP